MSVNIGAPQAIILAIYLMSLIVCCVEDGEQTTTHWWARAISAAVIISRGEPVEGGE